MFTQPEKGRFGIDAGWRALAESATAIWKPLLVAAPLIGTALFLASGTQAQTSGSATPSAPTSASGPVTPIASPEAARRKGPKVKVKEISTRVANPSTPGAPAADVPIAPIGAPEAARTGRPKERDKEILDTSRMAEPAPETEPVATPEAERTGRPKIKEGHQTPLRVGDPATQTPSAGTERRRKGPKGDSGSGRTATTPVPDAQPAGRGAKPKGASGSGRTAATPLIIGALGGAAILALVISGSNDRPASP